MYSLKRILVPQTTLPDGSNGIERKGACPRGYDHPCNGCKHIRMASPALNDVFQFNCFTMTSDDIKFYAYDEQVCDDEDADGIMGIIEHKMMAYYNDMILMDRSISVSLPISNMTLTEVAEDYYPIMHAFMSTLDHSLTTREITLENQELRK